MRPSPHRSTRRHLLAGGLLAALLALTGLTAAHADLAQQAKNLRLVTPRGEKTNGVFPVFTHDVEAKFDYVDAGGAALTFIVYGPGGLRLMHKDLSLTGTGTTSVAVTGRELIHGLATGLVANTEELQRAAAQAAGAQRGVREYLNGVQAALLLVRNAEDLVGWTSLPAAGDAKLAALATSRAELDALMARARLLEDADDAGLRGIAAQMATPAAAALSAARGFEAAVRDFDAALMPTGSGTAEAQAYVLSVLVDGQPAASALMWVKVPIYLPLTQQRR